MFESRQVIFEYGTLSYEIAGTGPLILCLPGLGDTVQEYDKLASKLVEEGFTVAVADLRGHGKSSAHWARYDVDALSKDIGAVLDAEKVDKALLIGCSISGSSCVNYAAHNPNRISGIVGFGPVLRAPFSGIAKTIMAISVKIIFADLWGAWLWGQFYRTLYPKTKPRDLNQYVRKLVTNLREPGRLFALREFMLADRDPSLMAKMKTPTLCFIGTKDPDFQDPKAEAAWIEASMPNASVHLMTGLGHYIHREELDSVKEELFGFAKRVSFSLSAENA